MLREIVRGHCMFLTLSYLKEHYPKDRVDMMEQYLKEEKSLNSKPRKRYLKMPSGKRSRFDVPSGDYNMVASNEMVQHEPFDSFYLVVLLSFCFQIGCTITILRYLLL